MSAAEVVVVKVAGLVAQNKRMAGESILTLCENKLMGLESGIVCD